MSERTFKVVTFVPPECLDALVDALREIRVNRLGNYQNCMSWMQVTSSWDSLEEAHPFLGTPGKRSVESECRLEFQCDESRLGEAVATIREQHPYEEPEIDIYPLLDPDAL